MKYTSEQKKESHRLEKQANKLLSKYRRSKFDKFNRLAKRNTKFIKQLRRKATQTEIIVGKWLLANNTHFIFQKGFFKPFHRIVDFYLPKIGIIEVDGGYHKHTRSKDSLKDDLWGKYRFLKTLRITDEQVLDGSFIPILVSFIGGRKDKRDNSRQSKYPKEWLC